MPIIKMLPACLNQTIIHFFSQPPLMRPNYSPIKAAYSSKKEFRNKGPTTAITSSLDKKKLVPIVHNAFCGLVFPISSDHLLREKRNSREKEKNYNRSSKNRHKGQQDKKDKQAETRKKSTPIGKKFIDSKLEKKLEGYFLFLSLSRKCLRAPKARKNEEKYTVYIGKGNNSKLLKKIFNWRHWWKVTSNPDAQGINLYWTQWSKKSIFDKLQESNSMEDRQKKYQRIVCQRPNSSKQAKKLIYFNQFNMLLGKKDRETSKSAYIDTETDVKAYLQAQSKQSKDKKKEQEKKDHSRLKLAVSCNHVQGHESITDKKNLFHNLSKYCSEKRVDISDIVPLTFHIKGTEEQFGAIRDNEAKMKEKNMWIVKPGEKSNRGNGIKVFKKVEEISQYIQKQKKSQKHPNRTYIIQQYIMPALFHRRKFDIRCFVLVISSPKVNAYFYQDGYLRTSSREFKDKKCDDKFIHLTNDAVQKKATDYGKFQKGNKVSFEEYQNYLDLFEKKQEVNFKQEILPAIKMMAAKAIAASELNSSRKAYSFELIGYDFMLDQDYRPWLIETNTNPSLEAGCPLLDCLFPSLINNVIKLAVDSVFKPPKLSQWPLQSLITFPEDILQPNKFELIYTQFQD